MKRWAKGFTVLLTILFLAVSLLPSAVLADRELTSETIQLQAGAYIQYSIDLIKNDRFEGNFTVSDLIPYQPVVPYPWGNNNIHTYSVSVTMIKSNPNPEPNKPYNPQKILDFNQINGNSLYSFDYTADYSGRYLVDFYCSEESNFPSNAIAPKITFKYSVIESTQLEINLLSPLSQTYNESSVLLNFTINRPVYQTIYSLDGNHNKTVDGNTTLAGLYNGLHNITLYAYDSYGNTVASDSTTFNVKLPEIPEPFPTNLVIAAVIVVAILGVSISLLLYIRKQHWD